MDGKCDYPDCNEPICEDCAKLKDPGSARYCEEHARQVNEFIDNDDPIGLFKWWSKSQLKAREK